MGCSSGSPLPGAPANSSSAKANERTTGKSPRGLERKRIGAADPERSGHRRGAGARLAAADVQSVGTGRDGPFAVGGDARQIARREIEVHSRTGSRRKADAPKA